VAEHRLTENADGSRETPADPRPDASVVEERRRFVFDAPVGTESLDETLAQLDTVRSRLA